MWRASCLPFYTGDLSFCGFQYPWEDLEQIPGDTQGQLSSGESKDVCEFS